MEEKANKIKEELNHQQQEELQQLAAERVKEENQTITQSFGNGIREGLTEYYKRTKPEKEIALSNFVMAPVELIKSDRASEMKVDIATANDYYTQKTINIDDFNSVVRFRKALNDIRLSFTGRDEDLQVIKNIIANKKYKTKTGVTATGFYIKGNKRAFVSGDKAISSNLRPISNIVMIESFRQLDSYNLDVEPITKSELQELSKSLFKFNDIEKTATIISFASAIYLKELLWQNKIKFPHLLIVGERGSGKSETVDNIMKPLLCTDNQSLAAGSITQFTLLKTIASSNTIPLIIEEYKAYAMGLPKVKELSNFLRDTYDKHDIYRGTANQEINVYSLEAPIILVGESGITEAAVKERSLELNFSKQDIENNLERQRHFQNLKSNKDVLNKLGRSLLEEALRIPLKSLQDTYNTALKAVNPKIAAMRIQNSIAVAITGLGLLESVYKKLGLDMSKCIGYSIKEIVEAINEAAFKDLLNENSNSRSVIDQTIEKFDQMAALNIIRDGTDYFVSGNELILNIKRIYHHFLKLVKDEGVSTEFIGEQEYFTRQLRRTSYFINYKTARFYDEQEQRRIPCRGYVLNIDELLNKGIDISYMTKQEEGSVSGKVVNLPKR